MNEELIAKIIKSIENETHAILRAQGKIQALEAVLNELKTEPEGEVELDPIEQARRELNTEATDGE